MAWEVLRWAYEEARKRLKERHGPDVIIVHAPHWITMVGHHVNCVPNPKGTSVEPIFPHLLRYHYDFQTDVELAEAIVDEADAAGLVASRMTDPGVRVDYATIGALHLLNPDWDIPVVSLSANNNPYYYSEAGLEDMETLGQATRRAIERTGRRAVLAASNSLSHLHWDTEPELPEDMAAEHPYNNHQYQWDMKLLETIRAGDTARLRTLIPEHIEQTGGEIKAGSLSWMLSAMGWPQIPGDVLGGGGRRGADGGGASGATRPDSLVLLSTQWFTVLGHPVPAPSEPARHLRRRELVRLRSPGLRLPGRRRPGRALGR